MRQQNRLIAGQNTREVFRINNETMRNMRFFLLAAWLCLSLGAYAQTTYYVGEGGNDNFPGTQAAPFATIGHAITQVNNSNDIIQVLAGEYQEPTIEIDRAVTISGLNQGQDVSVTPAIGSSPLFNITADGVTIQGLSLLGNAGTNGIVIRSAVENVVDITIQQNTISGFKALEGANGNGIVLANNADIGNLSIVNNFINENHNGILIGTGVSLTGAISENNLAENDGNALINEPNNIVVATNNCWVSGVNVIQQVIPEIEGNYVEYGPWLRSSNDLNPSVEGFQGDFSKLAVHQISRASNSLNNAIASLSENGEIFLYGNSVGYNLTAEKAATLIGVEYKGKKPVLIGFTINVGENNSINISNEIKANNITLISGNINVNSEASGLLLLSDEALNNLSEQNGRIIGRVASVPKNLPAMDTLNALGVTIAPNDNTGSDVLTNLFVERITGDSGIIQNTNEGGKTTQSIKVYWNINVDNESFSPRNLTLSWSSIYDHVIDPEMAIVWKNGGGTIEEGNWKQVNIDPIYGIVNATERSVTVPATSFSQYTVSDGNNPLPVVLTRFSAELAEPHVALDWETASEINSDFFSVERSENGKDFEEIGQLKAAGDSQQPIQYRYIDEQAAKRFSGSLFYRLRTVDFDGSFEYSDITTVVISEDDIPMITAFARQGQPGLKLFTRAIEPGEYHIWVTDLSGRKIFEQNVPLESKGVYEIGVGNLPQSVYLIRCAGKQIVLSSKFRVEEVN